MGVLLALLVNALTFNSFDLARLFVCVFISGLIGNLFSGTQIKKQAADRQVKFFPTVVRSLRSSVLIGLSVWLVAWLIAGRAYPDPGDLLHNGAITGLSSAISSFLLCMLFRRGKPQISPKFSSVSEIGRAHV